MLRDVVDIAVPGLTFFMMALVGMDIEVRQFAQVMRERRIILGGTIGQLVLLPALAVFFAWAFDPPPFITFGILLVAACPGGTISNFYIYLARANVPLSVVLTVVSCTLSALVVPLLFQAYTQWFTLPGVTEMPVKLLFRQLAVMVLLPIVLGMLIRRFRPAAAERHSGRLRLLGILALALLIAFIVGQQPAAVAQTMTRYASIAAVFTLSAFAAGMLTARALGASPRDRFTMALEFSTRNLAIAIAIAVTVIGDTEYAAFATAFFLIQVPLVALSILVYRRLYPA